MPNFRVVGVVSVHFIHEIEAKDSGEAEDQVRNIRLDGLDNYDMNDAETGVHTVIMLDADGNEVEDDD